MPDRDLEAAGELLRVLSAPVRLAIVSALADGPAPVHVLTDRVGQPQPLVSHHLRILRGARLARVSAQGRERVYALVDDHVALPHADHVDYAHDGHLHTAHGGHVDECEPADHAGHPGHAHVHGDGCGHVAVPHADGSGRPSGRNGRSHAGPVTVGWTVGRPPAA